MRRLSLSVLSVLAAQAVLAAGAPDTRLLDAARRAGGDAVRGLLRQKADVNVPCPIA